MGNKLFVYHLHSDYSTGVTNIDSATKYDQYIDRAKELGMEALAFSEHGSVFAWKQKKVKIEEAGMKYVHAMEAYITEDLHAKVRDNYHCVLIARNYEGVKEINKLSSKAFDKEDGHFYYNPRISFHELINTTDNVIICTACLGSILYKGSDELKERFIKFLSENKDRVFLEIQHHNDDNQKEYNKYLYDLHQKTGLRLIAGTDTHSLNDLYAEARQVLINAKRKARTSQSSNMIDDYEDNFDLTFKSYDELVEAYRKQDALPEDVYLKAIDNTIVLSDMIEEFELDYSHKYPSLWGDPEKTFQQKILQGIKYRHIDEKENSAEYLDRIKYEIETYKKNGAIDFMLLEEDYKSAMRKRGIFCGYGRGSVSGSVIAYLLGITEVDSISHKLNFERFMNTERVSLADIDSDWYADDREAIKKYLFEKKGLYCAEIITFNTIQLKGSIRDVGRALDIDKKVIDYICNTIETKEAEHRKNYPELFKWADILNGVIVSVGSHAAGFIVSPHPLDSAIGTFYTSESKFPVSQINMKEVDSLNYVKLDILSLDNIGLINQTCDLAGIERLTPDNTPADDINVWNSIRDNTTCIFQWEGSYAADYLKQLFSDETINNIKRKNPNFSYMDLLSIANGAIRPAGASYRYELSKGIYRDNGHKALNDFLAPTLGFLVFQEQIIEFLHSFCGYTMGQADIVRRHFSKKTGTEDDIPKIKSGFIKTMKEKYDVDTDQAEELIESFLTVIKDASDYLFSLNHADAYSWIGYVCGYLRYYYPLEFLTVALNIFENNEEKTKRIIEYAKSIGVSIKNIKFRYSLSNYNFNKDDFSIAKGMASIKYLNKRIADELYELRNNEYETFFDLLVDISKTSVNSNQLDILIKLNFFSEFGNPNMLLKQVEIYNNYISRVQFSQKDVDTEMYCMIKPFIEKETAKTIMLKKDRVFEMIKTIGQSEDVLSITTSLTELIEYETEYLDSISMIIPDLSDEYKVVVDISGKYSSKYITLHTLSNGSKETVKIRGNTLEKNPLKKGDVVKIINISQEKKYVKKADGSFERIDEYENILKTYIVLKK